MSPPSVSVCLPADVLDELVEMLTHSVACAAPATTPELYQILQRQREALQILQQAQSPANNVIPFPKRPA